MTMATANKMQTTTTTTRPAMPPVSTVYRAADGSLHHARCASRMEFQGRRAGLELDFYCLQCCEHITLTPYVLMRLGS
jgi:hypothetical protein